MNIAGRYEDYLAFALDGIARLEKCRISAIIPLYKCNISRIIGEKNAKKTSVG